MVNYLQFLLCVSDGAGDAAGMLELGASFMAMMY